MAWDDKSNGKKKNPWGNKHSNDERGGWGSGGGGSQGGDPPDLDEMLRKAQENFRNVLPGSFKGGPMVLLVIAGIAALWLSSGLYVVNPGEHAVIKRFGAWSRTQAEPGLGYHFPSPVESAEKVNVEEIRKMTIGFDEASLRGASLGKRAIPEESLMLTSDRNIVDLNVVIQWNIKSAEEYLFKVRDQEKTIKQVAESAIREIVGQTHMFPIITTGRSAVAEAIRQIIQTNLNEYESGVNITQVLIERAEVHPDVQGAFQDVQSAKQDAENVQNEAEAYREDILPKARGRAIQMLQQAEAYKQSTIARSNGDAARFSSVYEAYLSGKDVTKERIYIETMEEVLRNSNKVILDQQGGPGVVPYLPLNELHKKAPARPAATTTE